MRKSIKGSSLCLLYVLLTLTTSSPHRQILGSEVGVLTWPKSGSGGGVSSWPKSGSESGVPAWQQLGSKGGEPAWQKSGSKGGVPAWPKSGSKGVAAWPTEPLLENNYEAKGQLIKLDDTMQAYQIGSGSKMVVWAHHIFGLTGENSDKGRTKEWADFLAENGYNVLVPDWFRGNNMVGFFGPLTKAWLTSVTNWTNIQSDWENVIFPYLESQSPSSIGMIGTCWGSYPVVRLSMLDTISAGVSMHPSHPTLLATAGEDEEEVLELIKAPQLFLVEGDAGDSVKTGGLSEEVLGDNLTVVEFPDMTHGWTVRGDLDDPNIARDVLKSKKLVLEFFEKHLQ